MNNKQTNTTTAFRFKRYAKKSYSVFNSLQKVVTIGFLTGFTLMSAHASSVGSNEATRLEMKTDTIAEQELEALVVMASTDALPLIQST